MTMQWPVVHTFNSNTVKISPLSTHGMSGHAIVIVVNSFIKKCICVISYYIHGTEYSGRLFIEQKTGLKNQAFTRGFYRLGKRGSSR